MSKVHELPDNFHPPITLMMLLIMLLTFLLKMIMCKQYTMESYALHALS